MNTMKITAKLREDRGKGAAKRLRSQGYIPAVLYGKEVGNLALALDAKELRKVIETSGVTAVPKVVVGDEEYTAVFREIQRHPVRGEIIHCDLFQVSEKDRIETVVPIHLTGEAIGLKKGGILQYQLREVEIECQISQIPEAIVGDISSLDIGDSLRVEDLVAPEGVQILTDPESVVVSVTTPQVTEEEEEKAEEQETPTQEEAPAQEAE